MKMNPYPEPSWRQKQQRRMTLIADRAHIFGFIRTCNVGRYYLKTYKIVKTLLHKIPREGKYYRGFGCAYDREVVQKAWRAARALGYSNNFTCLVHLPKKPAPMAIVLGANYSLIIAPCVGPEMPTLPKGYKFIQEAP